MYHARKGGVLGFDNKNEPRTNQFQKPVNRAACRPEEDSSRPDQNPLWDDPRATRDSGCFARFGPSLALRALILFRDSIE